jgi:hypothetical protein
MDLIPHYLELAHGRARELLRESADRLHVDLDDHRPTPGDSFTQNVSDSAEIANVVMWESESSS